MKIFHIVGARPQFVKAAMVSKAWNASKDEYLLHTGQHYSKQMSKLFFDELKLRAPDVNLEVGSGNHADQIGKMLHGIDQSLEDEKPDHVIVYGDTNSTIAGALVASKRQIPFSHVEAGLRSYNRSMPEEINRVVSDHISNILFCPTKQAIENLSLEGISENVHLVGDVMADALYLFIKIAEKKSSILDSLNLIPKQYALATTHRAGNVDNEKKLSQIIKGFHDIGETIILPLHPRTEKMLRTFNLTFSDNVRVIEPIGYLDMLVLEKNAECILTDSGGVQKEAYLFGVRCITMREETEWTETIELGWNVLSGANGENISRNYHDFYPAKTKPEVYGSGDAADKIVQVIKSS